MVEWKGSPLLGGQECDWTRADDYPDPSSTSFEVLATEFMRRNPAFKEATDGLLETAHRTAIEAIGLGPVSDIPWPVIESRSILLASMYAGLHQKFYPNCWTDRIQPSNAQSGVSPTEHSSSPTTTRLDVGYRFNIEYPIEPQVEAARALLENKRKALVRDRKIVPIRNRRLVAKVENYRLYLRLLDARAAGASTREIATSLFPKIPNDYPDWRGDRAVRDNLRAARRLRDGDYRNLPLLEEIRPPR
jgi:hypothetical protein